MILCPPARTFLLISLIAYVIMFFQNNGNTDMYCVGTYNCPVYSTNLVFLVKISYILFWTWLLNLICGEISLIASWALVVFPFILMFAGIGIIFFNNITSMYENLTFYNLYKSNRNWNDFFNYYFFSNYYFNNMSSGVTGYMNPFNYVPNYLKP